MNLKPIDRRRCPWCGNIYYESDETCADREMQLCESCGRKVRSQFNFKNNEYTLIILSCFVIDIVLSIVQIVLETLFPVTEMFHIRAIRRLISLSPLLYFWTNREQFPVWRAHEVWEEKEIGRANIRWYSVKEGGVGLAKLRIIDNMIFPVCFLDATGKPVSQTVCVRLHKRGSLFWRKAKVKIISEDLWKADSEGKTPWEKAEKFVIFNNKEIVGEGRILR